MATLSPSSPLARCASATPQRGSGVSNKQRETVKAVTAIREYRSVARNSQRREDMALVFILFHVQYSPLRVAKTEKKDISTRLSGGGAKSRSAHPLTTLPCSAPARTDKSNYGSVKSEGVKRGGRGRGGGQYTQTSGS